MIERLLIALGLKKKIVVPLGGGATPQRAAPERKRARRASAEAASVGSTEKQPLASSKRSRPLSDQGVEADGFAQTLISPRAERSAGRKHVDKASRDRARSARTNSAVLTRRQAEDDDGFAPTMIHPRSHQVMQFMLSDDEERDVPIPFRSNGGRTFVAPSSSGPSAESTPSASPSGLAGMIADVREG